jgi:hypothetical protein
MTMSILIKVVSASVLLASVGLSHNRATVDPSPCLPPTSGANSMLGVYQFTDTTKDAANVAWRDRLSLPAVLLDQISIVSDTTVCRRAVEAFNTLLADKQASTLSVSVIKYGITRYVIGDPTYTVGEWTYELVTDSAFHKVAIAGR